MPNNNFVLSVQSHVAYGYVGNCAATIPLHSLGIETIIVNTVQLSNHTGYGVFQGDFFSQDHIDKVLKGVQERGVFKHTGAVLSGYLGQAELGHRVLDAVKSVKDATHGKALYICDPVMGDVGRGLFVKEGIPDFFQNHAMHIADIMTPNQFELELLSGITIKTIKDVRTACDVLHNAGVKIVLLTSLEYAETPKGQIQMLLSEHGKDAYIITTPKIKMDPAPNGSGDCTAALFCGHLLQGQSPKTALERTAHGIYRVFEETALMKRRELALIQCQKDFQTLDHSFEANIF
jgi:pyridoxine kinase